MPTDHQERADAHRRRLRPTASSSRRVDPAWTYRALAVLDVFLHVFVASTFVIGIWRASYELFVLYHRQVNPWIAMGSSIVVQLVRTVYFLDIPRTVSATLTNLGQLRRIVPHEDPRWCSRATFLQAPPMKTRNDQELRRYI